MTTRFGPLTKVSPQRWEGNDKLVTLSLNKTNDNLDLPFTLNDVAQPILAQRNGTLSIDVCLEDGRQLQIFQVGFKIKAVQEELVGGNDIIVNNSPITKNGALGENISFTKQDILDTISGVIEVILDDFQL